ncbi:MAG: hypothetical protein IH587_02540 [Anaerolineae bacterium]|nr:hypothetical protein [Anaerolineae bacterium]
MTFLGPIVGILLIALALVSVLTVVYMVMKEKHEHLEYFIPPQKPVEESPATTTQE